MKKKKFSFRILMLSLIIVLLCGAIGFAGYKTFFEDSRLRKLGYSYRQIQQLKSYDIDDQVTVFNQSLLYALSSREFNKNNLPYYLLFDSQMDLTRIVNSLAKSYTVEEVAQMHEFMDNETIESVADYEKIRNIPALKGILEKGYGLAEGIKLANSLPAEALPYFLSLNQLTMPENYLRYLANGFDNETICQIVSRLGDDGFNNLCFMRFYDELYGMISSELFNIDNLPRYLMYYNGRMSTTVAKSISEVNANKDVTAITDYSALDVRNPYKVEASDITMLVNRSHQLAASYLPLRLVEVSGNYRYGPAQLVEEAYENFCQMADDCLAETGKQILIYSGYRSYATIQAAYQQALDDSGDNHQMVDSFLFRAGFDESQTGLAVELMEKGQEKDDFGTSEAYKWMLENAHNYGFVLRYPQNREYLTKITFSDCHFRYVGVQAATVMNAYDWTLEEYHYLLAGN
ncbi:MAG: M15 family metallopeptidase [Erysipelotrichaceae bacterium]|nr:M15 family metallopeptidase [Erysipelotrichaceae bacterium]